MTLLRNIICFFFGHQFAPQISNQFNYGYDLTSDEKMEFCHRCFKMKGSSS